MPFCKIDDVKLYYEDYGMQDQLPLILLHGVMGNSESWKPQVEHFRDKRRIVVFDLRGHGQSDKPPEKYSIKQFSEDLFSFMKNLEIEKAIIAGHSMGGMIALKFALDHQEMVERLILIDTAAKVSFGRKLLLSISKFLMNISYESFVRRYISITLRKSYSQSELEKAQEKVLKTPKYVAKSCFAAIKDFDVTSELASIQVPTFIVHGSEDTQQPLSQAKYMKGHIPEAELVIIEGAGHAAVIESPEKIWEAIEQFIRK